MCPACLGTAATLVASATTVAGVTAFLLTTWRRKAGEDASRSQGDKNATAEDRVTG